MVKNLLQHVREEVQSSEVVMQLLKHFVVATVQVHAVQLEMIEIENIE